VDANPLVSQTILVFPYQTFWKYSDVECRCGRHKSRSSRYSWISIDDVLDLSTASATIYRVVYHTYGDASVNLYLSQPARLRRRQQSRTVYAAVNLKQNMHSTYIVSRGLSPTAELLVYDGNLVRCCEGVIVYRGRCEMGKR